MEEEKIDQFAVAQTISNGVGYEFTDFFLVKPLDPIKVKKEFSVPDKTSHNVDKNGVEADDFEGVVKEVKEVDSDYLTGVVIKIPMSYQRQLEDPNNKSYLSKISLGDTVVFRATAGMYFDLFKDSKLIRAYDIIAIKK